MESQIKKLFDISQKSSRIILGLMSGTSLDGLDLALCRCIGSGDKLKLELLYSTTVPYTETLKFEIKKIFAHKVGDIEHLALLNAHLGRTHAHVINEVLKDWKVNNHDVDLIASHGQTIYHAPKSLHQLQDFPNATLQISDGDHIAVLTGIITISDLRQKHVALGGEGAPLAKYGDYLLYRHESKNRVLLNLGGIANISFLPANATLNEIICSDIGPANILMNQYIQSIDASKSYDKNGELASKGKVNLELLNEMLAFDFFAMPLPKTTGPELFHLHWLTKFLIQEKFKQLTTEDVMATLSMLTAKSITNAIQNINEQIDEVMVSGGGVENIMLMKNLSACLGEIPLTEMSNAHEKEAMFFAALANEMVAGNNADINFGKLSFP